MGRTVGYSGYARSVEVVLGSVDEFPDHVFVVVVTFDGDHLVLCRHRERSTWETPGGHIEAGETPAAAAQRELFEETGIEASSLTPIADYRVNTTTGQVFVAEAGPWHDLPSFEMAETRRVRELPPNLTYPDIAPALVGAATAWRQGLAGRGRAR